MTIHDIGFGDLPSVGPGNNFTSPIFFGCDTCTGEVERAHAQLDEAFQYTSGLQQPSHCDSDEAQRACDRADEEGWDRVRELARSLVHALGVPEILR